MKRSAYPWLGRWFVVHFLADIAFAIPMMIVPVTFMGLLGWEVVDPIATRLVAAALFGIGIESWLGRNSSRDTFVAMLNLKIIWSVAAIVGILAGILQGPNDSLFAWLFLGIFLAFNMLWTYWRVRLGREAKAV